MEIIITIKDNLASMKVNGFDNNKRGHFEIAGNYINIVSAAHPAIYNYSGYKPSIYIYGTAVYRDNEVFKIAPQTIEVLRSARMPKGIAFKLIHNGKIIRNYVWNIKSLMAYING